MKVGMSSVAPWEVSGGGGCCWAGSFLGWVLLGSLPRVVVDGVGAFWGVADLEAGLRVDCLLCCVGAGFGAGWLGGSSASDNWLSNSGGSGKLKSGCCCAPAAYKSWVSRAA